MDLPEFDIAGLFAAMDTKRISAELSWSGAAEAIWAQSAVLNDRGHDHPISPATITGMAKRGDTTCQHALFFLRWLERSPESLLAGEGVRAEAPLPPCGPDRRLRWSLSRLSEALEAGRKERELTWAQLAADLRCTPNQLTGIRRAHFAIGMILAMRITQWLGRPAADFIYAARW